MSPPQAARQARPPALNLHARVLRDHEEQLANPHQRQPWGATPTGPKAARNSDRGTPSGRPASHRHAHPSNQSTRDMPHSRADDDGRAGGSQGPAAGHHRHETGQATSATDRKDTTCRAENRVGTRRSGRGWAIPHRSLRPKRIAGWHCLRHPSDARGLGRSLSAAKGWVLGMLARKGELRVLPVPRQRAPFSLAIYARPRKPHPRG